MFSYNELKKSFENRKLIGKLNSKNVFAISKGSYNKYIEDNSQDIIYIVFDDGNKLIDNGMVVGYVSSDGSVTDVRPKKYLEDRSPQQTQAASFDSLGVLEAVDALLKTVCDTSWITL